jgi:hypothetical protein
VRTFRLFHNHSPTAEPPSAPQPRPATTWPAAQCRSCAPLRSLELELSATGQFSLQFGLVGFPDVRFRLLDIIHGVKKYKRQDRIWRRCGPYAAPVRRSGRGSRGHRKSTRIQPSRVARHRPHTARYPLPTFAESLFDSTPASNLDRHRDWQLDADLVTLSGCETGLGRNVPGEGYLGFTHSFFEAEAQSVLVSLWRVDDRSTLLLMRRFYANWLAGMSKAAALQAAKRWLRDYGGSDGARLYSNPSFWAGFVLIGNRR